MHIKFDDKEIRKDIPISMLQYGHEVYGECYECGNGKIINYVHDEVFCYPIGTKTIEVNNLTPREYDARMAHI